MFSCPLFHTCPIMFSVTTASLAGQMISSEVPLMLSKAVEIFVTELTLRAWLHTEESKRRTVQVSHSFILSFSLYTFSHMSSSLQHNRIFIPSATLFCPCPPLSLFLLVHSPPPPTYPSSPSGNIHPFCHHFMFLPLGQS